MICPPNEALATKIDICAMKRGTGRFHARQTPRVQFLPQPIQFPQSVRLPLAANS